MDSTLAYLCRPRPWLPYDAETNHGLCHDLNPVFGTHFENKAPDWWESLLPGMQSHRRLVASFTQFMGEDYERLVFATYGRTRPNHDGLIQEAGLQLLKMDRCGCPDYLPADRSEEATGSGSWRAGCVDNPGRHQVYVFVDKSRQPSRTRGWWASIWRTVRDAYSAKGWDLIEVDDRRQAHIVVSWQVLAGSTIGLAQLPGAGHCRLGFFCKLDPGWEPSENQVSKLLAHELGHSANSGHLTGDEVMHPRMGSNVWGGVFLGAFGRRLDQFFGGEPPQPPTGEMFPIELALQGQKYLGVVTKQK